MEVTQQYGRWLRVEKDSGAVTVVNLDQVTNFHKCPNGTRFWLSNHDFISTVEDFEVVCMKVMATEGPQPPLSLRQLSLIDAAASEYDRQG